MMRKTTFFSLVAGALLAVLVCFSPSAEAQTFSSQGVIQDSNQNGLNQCADGAMRSQERALTIQQRINRVLNCNNDGQLYDSGSGACVDPGLSPAHVYDDDNAGDTLALANPDGTNGVAARIGGSRGSNITCMEDPVGCVFNGVTYDHGDSVVAYRVTTVDFGQSCNTQTNRETRTCNNGTLSGSFRHNDCGTEDPNNCTFNGTTIPHGGSVTAYEVERVSSSGTCNSETRVCTDGNLSGSFLYSSCEPDLPVTPDPPTTNCFFWVSGYVPGAASVGATDIHSNHVGRGAYPDATIPFAKANAGTFDAIAIGPKTRLVVYKGKNYTNGEFIDIHGPIYIGNQCLPADSFPRDWKSDTTPLVSSQIMRDGNFKVSHQKYVNMFPPNKRIERVMNGSSAGCLNNPHVAGAASQELLWGGGSIKVYCDAD